MASLPIPWSLLGTTVFNTVTALCLAPIAHRELKMAERAEIALSGFLAMDLFKLVSDKKCREMQLPAGSCWFAGQTMQNLQSVALSAVALTLSKPEWMNVFEHGTLRLSEVSIEQHFGHLRSQAKNALLTARSYFVANARQSMRTSDRMNKMKPPKPPKAELVEDPLSDEQPLSY